MPPLEPTRQSKRVIATMSMIVRTPRPSSPTIQASAPRNSVSQDAFERIAHLALEALDLHRVLRPVRAPARQQETGQAAGGLGQRQEGIAHRRRNEKLVADQFIGLPRTFLANRVGACRVGAHVRPALLLRHRHADGQRRLLIGRHVARVITVGGDPAFPERGQFAAGGAAPARQRRSSSPGSSARPRPATS